MKTQKTAHTGLFVDSVEVEKLVNYKGDHVWFQLVNNHIVAVNAYSYERALYQHRPIFLCSERAPKADHCESMHCSGCRNMDADGNWEGCSSPNCAKYRNNNQQEALHV